MNAQHIAKTGAELAGNCEGEQIADLIALAIAVAESKNRGEVHWIALASRATSLVSEIKRRESEVAPMHVCWSLGRGKVCGGCGKDLK